MKAVRVAASPFDIVPSEVMRLLATEDGRTFGYGYGPGWSLMFGSEHGDVTVLPGQWVIRHDDGTVTVQDREPSDPSPTETPGLLERGSDAPSREHENRSNG